MLLEISLGSSPLFICSNAKNSGLFVNGLTELKDLVIDTGAIQPNLIGLSNT